MLRFSKRRNKRSFQTDDKNAKALANAIRAQQFAAHESLFKPTKFTPDELELREYRDRLTTELDSGPVTTFSTRSNQSQRPDFLELHALFVAHILVLFLVQSVQNTWTRLEFIGYTPAAREELLLQKSRRPKQC